MVDILVMLLSMENDKTKFFTGKQRSEIYRYFRTLLSTSGSNNTNPCRFRQRARNNNELKLYNAYNDHLARMEKQTYGTPSARDQIAKQSRPYEQSVANNLRQPIVELVDEQACQAAFSALNGLTFFKGWDMSAVTSFMIKNTSEPISAEVLLMGTKVLIETNKLDNLYSLHLDLIREEDKYASNDDLKFPNHYSMPL